MEIKKTTMRIGITVRAQSFYASISIASNSEYQNNKNNIK